MDYKTIRNIPIMIFAIIALLLANVSTARAEENFGFSIAGVEVSDENCDVIGKMLSWSNFLLSGEVTYNRATNTLTLDNADIWFPFGRSGIRNDSCPDLTIVVKGACKLQNAMFDSGYYHIVVERATHVVGTPADTLYMEGGLGLCTRANLSKLSYDGDSDLYLDSLTLDIDLHWAHCFSAYDGAKIHINRASIVIRQIGSLTLPINDCLVFSDGWGFVYPEGIHYEEEKGYVDKDGNSPVSAYYGGKHLPNPITVIIRSLDDPFQQHDIWIESQRLNELNRSDIKGDGSVVYNPETKTLTLTDANIQGKGAARGTITERGYGIYSEEPGVTYEVKGTCTVAGDVDNPALVFYGTYTNPNKATITGDGTLNLKSNIEAIYDSGTNDTLTIGGNVTVEAEGSIYGYSRAIPGKWGRVYYNSLLIKDNAVVKAKGSGSPILNWKELMLEDEHAITEPEGAYWDAEQHRLLHADSSEVDNEWVTIRRVKSYNRADVNRDGTVDSADIVAVIKEMPDGDKKADVNNDGAIDSADIVAVIKVMK